MVEMVKAPRSVIRGVPLNKMRVSNPAQRDLQPPRVDYLVANFDLEDLGYPVLSDREGHFWIIDGQHRVEALKRWIGKGWDGQQLTCRVYAGMNETEEAEMFIRLNNVLTVSAFDKFKVSVTAGRTLECNVKKAVEKSGLTISRAKGEGRVSAVGCLTKVLKRSNGPTLSRSLNVVYQSFGDPGLSNNVIDGIARVCERYNGALDDTEAIEKLRTVRGGIGAVMSRAAILRKQTGVSIPECVAAAVVDTLNAKKGGKKLPSWWKE